VRHNRKRVKIKAQPAPRIDAGLVVDRCKNRSRMSRHSQTNRRNPSSLSQRQARFCRAYAESGDVNLAAEATGYTRQSALRVLDREDCQAYIKTLLAKVGLTVDEVLEKELLAIATADSFRLGELGCRGSDKMAALLALAKQRGVIGAEPQPAPEAPRAFLVVPSNGRGPDTTDAEIAAGATVIRLPADRWDDYQAQRADKSAKH
jgi:hypothetical protein